MVGYGQRDTSIIKADSLRHWVRWLSHDSMQGRLTGTPQAMKAANWISNQFKRIGLQPLPGSKGFTTRIAATTALGQTTVTNVVGRIAGKFPTGPSIVLCAHYDHIGTGYTMRKSFPLFDSSIMVPTAEDSIFNGANDNASGVASLIALARYFAKGPRLPYNLIFAAFSGEELGLIGSDAFIQFNDINQVRQVINLEMLGRSRGSSKTDHLPYITHSESDSWVVDSLNAIYRKAKPSFRGDYFQFDPFKTQLLYQRSDNYSFAKEGKVANTIMMTHPNDRHYHQVSDEWDTLDYNQMERTVRAIAFVLDVWFSSWWD